MIFSWPTPVARSINDHGDIVGTGFSMADLQFHALRFADGQVIALETEVDDIADWQLHYAWSVSEAVDYHLPLPLSA